jgi:hypothetical protein
MRPTVTPAAKPPNSVIAPVAGLMRPIAWVVPPSVNQRLPSVPTVIAAPGMLPGFRPALNSVIWPVVGLMLGDRPVRRDPPDRPGGAVVGEPDVAVRSGRDPEREAARVEAGAELGDRPVRPDPSDRLHGAVVAEPHVAVGPHRDRLVRGARVQAGAELGDRAVRRDAADRPGAVGEPEVAVGARPDLRDVAPGVEPGAELGDLARRGGAGDANAKR